MFKGMKNMGKMLKDAQKLQKELAERQKELEETIYEHSTSNMIFMKANGKKEILEVSIKDEVIDVEDKETLEDLILVTCNELIKKIEKDSDEKIGGITNSLNIPF